MQTLVVDSRDGDWSERRAAIARFLGFAPVAEPSPSATQLARYVGRYRVAWKNETRECAVRLDQGRLVIDGLLWPANRLLWKAENVFDAESWPLEVVFESVGGLSVRGPSCVTPKTPNA